MSMGASGSLSFPHDICMDIRMICMDIRMRVGLEVRSSLRKKHQLPYPNGKGHPVL
jgi:hypothetical protein